MSQYTIQRCLENAGLLRSSNENNMNRNFQTNKHKRCNSENIIDEMCIKNIVYFDYCISHDGYDEDGPESDLYDLFFITKERNIDYECLHCGNELITDFRNVKFCHSCECYVDENDVEEDNDEITYFYVLYHYRYEDWYCQNQEIRLVNSFTINNKNKKRLLNYSFFNYLREDDKNVMLKKINKIVRK